jgi:MFS family permease
VESIVAFGSLLTVHIWSHLSDKYGRKPILLISVGANCLLSGTFGFSKSYRMLLLVRFLMGLAKSGQAATTKVMLAESADGSQLARGFAILG